MILTYLKKTLNVNFKYFMSIINIFKRWNKCNFVLNAKKTELYFTKLLLIFEIKNHLSIKIL